MSLACLMIDDDTDDQEIFSMALRAIDTSIKLETAGDGPSGIRKVSSYTTLPDYIFVDLNMPKMNGIETMKEIVKMIHGKRPVITIYSTSSEKKLIDDALAAGADHFIVKPPSLAELVAKLKLLFEEHARI